MALPFFQRLSNDLRSGRLNFTVGTVGSNPYQCAKPLFEQKLFHGEAQFVLSFLGAASVFLCPPVEQMDDPILNSNFNSLGVSIVGAHSSGKSQIPDTIKKMLPVGMVETFAGLSPHSLEYLCAADPNALRRKVVILEESTSLENEDLQNLLRNLLSKGKAPLATVVGGKFVRLQVEGPISFVTTGLTEESIRKDTNSRCILIESDTSEETNEKFINSTLKRAGVVVGVESAFSYYRAFFENLKAYRVLLPEDLATRLKVSKKRHEARRAIGIFLSLLSTITLIEQASRKKSHRDQCIDIDSDDLLYLLHLIEHQNIFTHESILGKGTRDVMKFIQNHPDLHISFRARQIIAESGYSDGKVKSALPKLLAQGNIERTGESPSGEYLYSLRKNITANWLGLPDVNSLLEQFNTDSVRKIIEESQDDDGVDSPCPSLI